MISPNGIQVSQAALHLDIPVMLAVAIVCLPIFITGRLIDRGEGLLFVANNHIQLFGVHVKIPLAQRKFRPIRPALEVGGGGASFELYACDVSSCVEGSNHRNCASG